MDQDDNEYRSRQYEKESPSFSGEKNRQKIVKRTEVAPIRISNNKQPMESSNIQISSLSPGVRITLPAFTVKVSTSQNSLRGILLALGHEQWICSLIFSILYHLRPSN